MNETSPIPPSPVGPEAAPATPVNAVQKFPVGLIFIVILTGLGMIGSLPSVLNPMIVVGTYVVTGFPALAYAVVQLAVYVALFTWLIKRKEWGRILGIAISCYNMLFLALNFMVSVYEPEGFMEAYDRAVPGYSDLFPHKFLVLVIGSTAILTWLVGGTVIAYLHFKKRYFHR